MSTLSKIKKEVLALKRERETITGYLRAHPEVELALQKMAEARGLPSTGALLVQLVQREVARASESISRAPTRQRLLSDRAVRRYLPQVEAACQATTPDAAFLVVDQRTGEVRTTPEWPKAQTAGMAVLDMRNREAYSNLAGQVTPASILAWLCGWPRPDEALEKAMFPQGRPS